MPRARPLALRGITAALACLLAGATTVAGGATPPAPALDEVLATLAARFGPVRVAPPMAAARDALVGSLLRPSRVFERPGLWSLREGDRRGLAFGGHSAGGEYRMDLEPAGAAPTLRGDWHRHVRLQRLAADEYEWSTRDELVLSRSGPSEVARAVSSLLETLEGSDGEGLASRFPGTRVALGGLVSLRPTAAAAGRSLTLALDPLAVAKRLPRFSRFLADQIVPMHARLSVAGAAEQHVLDLSFDGGVLRVTRAATAGPTAADGGTLRVEVALTRPVSLFRVGFRQLTGGASAWNDESGAGIVARFEDEPRWRLPFFLTPFLRSPLRRPFEGDGVPVRVALEAAPAGGTLLVWEYRLRVRESRIVRWLGGLGGGTAATFHEDAEPEARAFVGAVLAALRGDVRSLPAPAGTTARVGPIPRR